MRQPLFCVSSKEKLRFSIILSSNLPGQISFTNEYDSKLELLIL